MALSFLSVGNQQGSACYIIHGSRPDDIQQVTEFQADVHQEYPNKVVLIEKNSHDARELTRFYSIHDNRYPLLLLVREDDSLTYQWSSSLPNVQDLTYRLRQIGD